MTPAADVAGRALAHVLRDLDRFRLSEVGSDSHLVGATKRAGELATLARALAPADRRSLVDFAWHAMADGTRLAEAFLIQPASICCYPPFVHDGLRCVALETMAHGDLWHSRRTEWPVFVQYAVGAALTAIGIPPPWSGAFLLQQMGLYHVPGPNARADRGYLASHAVMWETDLGEATPRFRVPDPGGLVGQWIAWAIRAGNLDLLGEWLVAAHCLHVEAPAAAWRALADAQRDDGGVPASSDGSADADADLHTTLVVALAGQLARGRDQSSTGGSS